MVKIQYANAMAEVLHYLKGIREEDIDKIPKKLMFFLQENASKEYTCKFDYNKPLQELNILDETRGIISAICLNYWCITAKQKKKYLSKLEENEKKYQNELREKYNPDNIFKNKSNVKETAMIEYKETVFNKIMNWIKTLFYKKR